MSDESRSREDLLFSLFGVDSGASTLPDNVELLASKAYAKQIGLGCYISPDVPETINSDPGRLRQVLLNLASNAVKFTQSGGVLVSVEIGESGGKQSLRFSIRPSATSTSWLLTSITRMGPARSTSR